MMKFLKELKSRSKPFFYFGIINLISAIICIPLILLSDIQVLGINAWIKPFKFFVSSVIFCWSMGWYLSYLKKPRTALIYSWVVILVFTFENVYIFMQASKGELSHFNVSSAFHGLMFAAMGIAISIMTLWTAYIAILFFINKLPDIPASYKWGIRFGIVAFVIFAFEGGMMGANLAHTVGAPDGGPGLPLVNWSTQFGDLRIAHFAGMHALQVFPIVGFYVIRKSAAQLIFMFLYVAACFTILYQALSGSPLIGIG
ncbi:MAG: hypothetical protein AAFQ94_01080 [Bacteroidota bacterium]